MTNGHIRGEQAVFIRTDAPLKEFKRLRRKSKEQVQEFTVPRAATKIRAIQKSDSVKRSFSHH